MFYCITGGWVEFISTFATPLQGQGVRNFFLNVCLFISNVDNCTLQLTTTPPQGWVLFACSFPALTIVLTTTPRQGCVELFLKVCLFICSVDRASAGNEPRNVQILDAALPTMNSVFAQILDNMQGFAFRIYIVLVVCLHKYNMCKYSTPRFQL